jgi:hypothetical protein
MGFRFSGFNVSPIALKANGIGRSGGRKPQNPGSRGRIAIWRALTNPSSTVPSAFSVNDLHLRPGFL